MTSKPKRKYGDLAARQINNNTSELIDDVFASFTGKKPSQIESQETITAPNETTVRSFDKTSHETSPESAEQSSNETSFESLMETFEQTLPRPSDNISIQTFQETTVETSAESSLRIPGRRRAYQPLDATHTSSEQKIYGVMYRRTITKGIRQERLAVSELMRLSGINSNTTVIKALNGLAAKQSIRVVSKVNAKLFGILYEVYEPKEIFERRERAGIVIEPRRKMIVESSNPVHLSASKIKTTPKTTGETSSETSESCLEIAQSDMQNLNNHVNEEEIRVVANDTTTQEQNNRVVVDLLIEQLNFRAAQRGVTLETLLAEMLKG